MNIFIIIEIKKPITPNAKIPKAETLAIVSNSFLVGFFKTNQTLLHFKKNDFVDVANFFTIKRIRLEGF